MFQNVMDENLKEEQQKELAPPPPSGASVPETYIRTLPADAEAVKVGEEPELVPHTSVREAASPANLPGADTPAPAVFGKSPGHPSQKQQSWGTVIAIVIIVVMVVIGAFYAWGKRVAEQRQYPVSASS